jgi:hypothetical protein
VAQGIPRQTGKEYVPYQLDPAEEDLRQARREQRRHKTPQSCRGRAAPTGRLRVAASGSGQPDKANREPKVGITTLQMHIHMRIMDLNGIYRLKQTAGFWAEVQERFLDCVRQTEKTRGWRLFSWQNEAQITLLCFDPQCTPTKDCWWQPVAELADRPAPGRKRSIAEEEAT